MPKMKTHRGAAKRFKVTGTGKSCAARRSAHHMLEKKSSVRTRAWPGEAEVTGGDKAQVKRLLGL